MVAFQRAFILARVKERSQSHVVYALPEPGRKKGFLPMDIPGFVEGAFLKQTPIYTKDYY